MYVPGDEVIEWNGRPLQGKTYQDVYEIIAESRQEPQVELIVSRNLQKGRPGPWKQQMSYSGQHKSLNPFFES